ncbi:MAG: hypothetical protein K8R58_11440, partial [Bacteroidales bacterium]|nr:hypothetical protein [Bacteroidales bacterium]
MSKKKNRKKNQIPLIQVIQHYEQGNYSRANELLKKAKITSEESGIAKQLKVEIANQVSISYFKEYKFKEAIQCAESTFNIQPKPEYPLPNANTNIIIGLSHLFLGNYNDAIQYLKSTHNNPETSSFYFYYILAELYNNQYESCKSIVEFNNLNKEYLEQIPDNKKAWLQAVFYLIKNKFLACSNKLKEINTESHVQTRNLEFLINYLNKKRFKQEYQGLKPLYKFLSGFELSFTEELFLHHFQNIKQYHKNIKSKIKNKDLSDNINNLCFNAIPLDERILDLFISDNELKDNFKYIIYNNVNALVSDFNIEYNNDGNYELANRYINKFRNYFFQIPESVFLYLSFTHMLDYLKDDLFFRNILYYININRKT